ncbi:MAG TPA: hypothetical protein VGR02_07715 [Thermoanaerobaculia bacterium]|jgi:hypothetical protein|nr:hypothetical protein [Thermoanaerobaculia bacterium]
MTLYGELKDRFGREYRPRPAAWRIALVSFCQLVVSVTLANAIVSAIDMYVFQRAWVKDLWLVYAVPWSTLAAVARPRQLGAVGLEAQLAGHHLMLPATAAFLAFALLVIYFWPTKQTVATRLFSVHLAEAFAAFGAGAIVVRAFDGELPSIAILAAAAVVCIAGEWAVNNLLANVVPMRNPAQRAGFWFLRIVPATLAIGASSELARYEAGALCAAGLLVVTLFANVARRPAASYEQVLEPELREAAAAWPFVLVALLMVCTWAFGFAPIKRPARAFDALGTRLVEPSAAVKAAYKPPGGQSREGKRRAGSQPAHHQPINRAG